MHHCYIGLPQRRIPLCHNKTIMCFFGAICGCGPITTLTCPSFQSSPGWLAGRYKQGGERVGSEQLFQSSPGWLAGRYE
jgi:hypothetical protein